MKGPWRVVVSLSILSLGALAPSDLQAGETKPTPPAAGAGLEQRSFDDVVRGLEVVKGLFTFYRNVEKGTMLMEVLPDQLDKPFLFASTMDRAVGERGFYGSQVGVDFHFSFHRVGETLQWLQRNTSFSAAPGTPAARATARSFGDAILGSAALRSLPHPQRRSLLVEVSDLFVADAPAFVIALNEAYQPTEFQFDKERSAALAVRAFPENVLLEVGLHYTTSNPKVFSIALPDPRSVPIVMKYELSALEPTGYRPRVADDRVGHFVTVQQDFSSDRPASPYVRYVRRWQLEKADPAAALSPPKQPIVFWLENTIPIEYRAWISEGILLWNKAFERIGLKDVLVVKQQPDDADWDPADTRYSTVRWFAGVDASSASGYFRSDPLTGQTYDADITISDGFVRNIRRYGEEYVAPVAPAVAGLPALWARAACTHAAGLAEQAAFGRALLDARGALTPQLEERLMHEVIVELMAHEVGHTLGLRHNFRASAMLRVDELNDVGKTTELGQSGSVMDYNPIVVAGKGETQGSFTTTTLGPYDYWAIEYAYQPIEGDESVGLAKIASRGSADSRLLYATDEDALATFSADAMDPLANQWDQSDDPLAYDRRRVRLVGELWAGMESNLARPGEGYQVFRRALERGLTEYYRALLTSSKFIGGIHHRRDHVGDPGGQPPYTPVAAARQREALDFLRASAFAEQAFRLPWSAQRRLAIERLPDLDWRTFFTTQRLDYPWHDAVLRLQRDLLDRLYHPLLLGRLQDNELRFGPEEQPFRMAELFTSLDASIWSELVGAAPEIPSLRRNLQREQLQHLLRLALRLPSPPGPSRWLFPPPAIVAPLPPPPAPEDATTLARASLSGLQGKIRRKLAAGAALDLTTRAHLEETQARITAALEARAERVVD